MKSETYQKLEKECGEIDWKPLKPHLKRDVLIKVDPVLDLISVGEKMVMDDKIQIQKWMEKGQIVKIVPETAEDYDKKELQFRCIIIEPFVLFQVIEK